MSSVCPDWDGSIPQHQIAEFRRALRSVLRLIDNTARKNLIHESATRQWHRRVFSKIVPLDYYAGNWRSTDLATPCLRIDVNVNGICGTPFSLVPDEMDAWGKSIRAFSQTLELKWPTLDKNTRMKSLALLIGEAVGLFVKIHPFRDGNGRMSRLLWYALLRRFHMPPQARIHPRPDTPYGALMTQAMSGNVMPLQVYVLHALAASGGLGADQLGK